MKEAIKTREEIESKIQYLKEDQRLVEALRCGFSLDTLVQLEIFRAQINILNWVLKEQV